MQHLAEQLPAQSTWLVVVLENAAAVQTRLPDILSDGDLVLIKSSHGTGLHKVVTALKQGVGA